MSAYSPARARPYDLFKTVVTVILLIIILIMLLRFGATPAPATPAIGVFNVRADGELGVTGRGQPGSQLELWAGTTRLGGTKVAADGTWTFAGKVAPGDYQLIARAVDAAGNTVNESASVNLSVPATAAAAVASTVAPAPSATLASALAPTPAPAPTATPAPTAAPTPAPPTAAPTALTAIALAKINPTVAGAAGKLALTGTGQPGATLELWANGNKLAPVTVGSDGKWSYDGQVQPGDYRITARTVDASGKILNESEPQAAAVAAAATATSVPPQATAAPASEGTAYVVQPGDWLTKLAIQFYGDMSLYTRIVDGTNAQAARDSSFAHISDSNVIEVGQKLWIPAK